MLAHRYLSARSVCPGWHHAGRIFKKLRQPVLLLQFSGPSLPRRSDGPEPDREYCSGASALAHGR